MTVKTCNTVGKPLPHDSAHLHVSGQALYIDDLIEPQGLLHAAIGVSEQPHANIKSMNLDAVRTAQGVVAVITATDILGMNDYGATQADDPILASGLAQYVGQPLFAVAANNVEQARRAAKLAVIDYQTLEPMLTIDAALEKESYVLPSETLSRGDAAKALAKAPLRLQGQVRCGGQDHFYLEGHIAVAIPQEDGAFLVHSSTQHPGEVQHLVARALGRPDHTVTVECRRMGGGFGGKETQPALIACIAALLAEKTQRPVKLRLDRDADMMITGKRHDYRIDYDVGFDDQGRIQGIEFSFASRCGMSADLSGPVNDRTMFHCDNAYYLDAVAIRSHRCKTNTVSNTAFRGFGGPQGMLGIETVIDEIARYLGKDPLQIRKVNLYRKTERNTTPYGMQVEDNILPELLERLEASSEYQDRRQEIDKYNAQSPILKRGIALTPVKFGISFTATHFNQAGALLHVYTDGSVMLNHGGTEMGQGLYIKVAQVVAEELQIDIDRIKLSAADTSKVPNASATAASSGSDLNGMAARVAARTIKQRLVEFAAQYFQVAPEAIKFQANRVAVGGADEISFTELVKLAYMNRVSLSATGFYKTPKIHYDRKTFSGRPFYYFAYGAAVSEVIIDTLTGESRTLRVDILHDAGRSLNPAIDRGQVEGGFVQGMGWLTCEELWWNEKGVLMTHAPSTYKIPTGGDLPPDFRVELLENTANREDTVYRSKAVGEPPFMLAISVFLAIKDAIASAAGHGVSVQLNAPATPEEILKSSPTPPFSK